MKIGVISDTHDNMPMIRKAVELFNSRRDVEHVVHAGDIIAPFALKAIQGLRAPLTAVLGNNDGEHDGLKNLMPELDEPPIIKQLGGRSVCLTHSIDGARNVDDADVIVYGHDHQADIDTGPPLKVNPGECCGYLTGRSTVAIVDLVTLEAEIVDLT